MRLVFFMLLLLTAAANAAVRADSSILTYHGDQQRDGNTIEPTLTWQAAQSMHRDTGFDGTVTGHVYTQPLYWRPANGRPEIVVATESDVVAALDEPTGHTIWSVTLGRPVPRSALPCGNIDPLGITGTPVIDPRSGSIYLDAMVDRGGTPAHLVFGLSLADGRVLPGWPIDVQSALRSQDIGFTPREQNQRSALALLGNRVYVAFGGNFGDCGRYHGIVLGLDISAPHEAVGWSTRGLKGGIWAPGGIAVTDGTLLVTTGNTEGAERWADGEAVIRLRPDLAHQADTKDFYAPRNWKELDDNDFDMSGVNPMPFDVAGAGRVLALGKDGNAYLLDAANLGGIGGQIAVRHVAGTPIITAPAFFPEQNRMVVAFQARRPVCPGGQSGGLEALAITPSVIAPLWCAKLDGRGSAMVTTTDGASQPIVWIAGAEGDDRLHAFRGDTGAPIWTGPQLAGLRHFVTAMAAGQRIYIAGDGHVYAFTWSGS